MKILHLLYENFDNDIRVIKEANIAAKQGDETRVLALYDEKLLEEEEYDVFKAKRLRLLSQKMKYNKIVKLIMHKEFSIRVLEELKKGFIPDVVHCHNPLALPVAFKIKLKLNKKIKIIYDSHEYVRGQNTSRLMKKQLVFLENKYIKKVDRIITVGKEIGKLIQNDHSLKELPVVIRNIPYFYETKSEDLFRKEFKIPDDKMILLYQGGLQKNRGLKKLIEITEKLDGRFVLIFMGRGELLKDLKEIVKEKKMVEKIYFKDFVENKLLLDYTNSADMGIYFIKNTCLNHFYCLPNKIFEFIQGGLPIVTSSFPELEKIVNGNNIGRTFNPNDTDEIVKGITEIIDKNEMAILKENILKIKEDFSWEKEARVLENLYKEIFLKIQEGI